MRTHRPTGAAQRSDGDDAARAAKIRRNAWLLAGAAVVFYVGYMAWIVISASVG